MKRISFVSWRYEKKKKLITLYEATKIIHYTRQHTPMEIIQTAFIFCILNIMFEFLKPFSLIFCNIYYITISRNFQH